MHAGDAYVGGLIRADAEHRPTPGFDRGVDGLFDIGHRDPVHVGGVLSRWLTTTFSITQAADPTDLDELAVASRFTELFVARLGQGPFNDAGGSRQRNSWHDALNAAQQQHANLWSQRNKPAGSSDIANALIRLR